jgi:hypothetical protein
MLDMGIGARTTSIKPLSTLIQHVMCQSCNEINILVLQNKSLVIIQINQETSFKQILTQEKLKEFPSNYVFFENNQRLTENNILSRGNHYVHFKGNLKGEMKPIRIFTYLSTAEEILKEVWAESPDNPKYLEEDIKRSVEGFIMGSFDIKRILCPSDTRLKYSEEERFDHIRDIIERNDYRTNWINKETIDEFYCRFFFIVDRFKIPEAYSRSRRCWEHTLMVLVGSNLPWLVVSYCL